MTPAGTNLFFEVEDGSGGGVELVADNAGGTQVVLDTGTGEFPPASYGDLSHFTAVGSSLYFLSGSGGGNQLWTSDGTVAGTTPVSVGGSTPASIGDLTALGNTLVFDAQGNGVSGEDDELWSASPGGMSATMIEDFGAQPSARSAWRAPPSTCRSEATCG